MEIVSEIGGSTLNGLSYIGSLASLGARAAYYTLVAPFQRKAVAPPARDFPGHGHRRPRLTDPVSDYFLHLA